MTGATDGPCELPIGSEQNMLKATLDFGQAKALPANHPHVACVMMVKNEADSILTSLRSIIGVCYAVVMFDTGSTDATIDVVEAFCSHHGIKLHLKQGEFINFSASRNELLDYLDNLPDVKFGLMMDAADQLRGAENFLKFLIEYRPTDKSNGLFHVRQMWWSGEVTYYYNSRLVIPNNRWRYKGAVHEFMTRAENNTVWEKTPESVMLYQDRTTDNGKSAKRFARDYQILKSEYDADRTKAEADPTFLPDPRTVFYLAQTCECMGNSDQGYVFYAERVEMKHGFGEEIFESHMRMGKIANRAEEDRAKGIPITNQMDEWDSSLAHYHRAFCFDHRAEPLVKMAEHYRTKEERTLAFVYAKLACELEFPTSRILFIDRRCYDHTRWHVLGILAWYFKEFTLGKNACMKALGCTDVTKHISELDQKNLKFYLDHEKQDVVAAEKPEVPKGEPPVSKAKFIEDKARQLLSTNSKLTHAQARAKALVEWKNRTVSSTET